MGSGSTGGLCGWLFLWLRCKDAVRSVRRVGDTTGLNCQHGDLSSVESRISGPVKSVDGQVWRPICTQAREKEKGAVTPSLCDTADYEVLTQHCCWSSRVRTATLVGPCEKPSEPASFPGSHQNFLIDTSSPILDADFPPPTTRQHTINHRQNGSQLRYQGGHPRKCSLARILLLPSSAPLRIESTYPQHCLARNSDLNPTSRKRDANKLESTPLRASTAIMV